MKATALIFLLLLFTGNAFCQNKILRVNAVLIDSMEEYYTQLSNDYTANVIPADKTSKDISLLLLLNNIYLSADSLRQLTAFLYKNHFKKEEEYEDSVKMKSFSKYGGNLRVRVDLFFNKEEIIDKRIIVATNSKFYCKTVNGSAVISYFDFPYFRSLLGYVQIPFKLYNTRVEIVSVSK